MMRSSGAEPAGVSRATLYRQAGNREQLLSEVIWWRSRLALVAALKQTQDEINSKPPSPP